MAGSSTKIIALLRRYIRIKTSNLCHGVDSIFVISSSRRIKPHSIGRFHMLKKH